MTWLFLDCEWADTLASELVSLALVPDDPALPEFYAERHILQSRPRGDERSGDRQRAAPVSRVIQRSHHHA